MPPLALNPDDAAGFFSQKRVMPRFINQNCE
jgi:hypothetical protein